MDRVPEAELHLGEPEESPRGVSGNDARKENGPGDAPQGEPDGGPTRTPSSHGGLKMSGWASGLTGGASVLLALDRLEDPSSRALHHRTRLLQFRAFNATRRGSWWPNSSFGPSVGDW